MINALSNQFADGLILIKMLCFWFIIVKPFLIISQSENLNLFYPMKGDLNFEF